MKALRTCIVATSVALNLLLLCTYVFYVKRTHKPEVRVRIPEPDRQNISLIISNRVILSNPTNWWAGVEAPEYPVFIRRLRGVGCPENTIRDIVTAELNRLYAPRITPLKHRLDIEYWRTGWHSSTDYHTSQELRELENEKKEIIRILLGPEAEAEYSALYDDFDQQFAYLPQEKRSSVADIHLKYSKLEEDIRKRRDGQFSMSLWKEMRDLRQKWKEELGNVLSPEELRQYELRTSSSASQLRGDLSYLDNVSQSEFDSLFDARSKFFDQFPSTTPLRGMTDEDYTALGSSRQALTDSIRSTLGERRYQEYVRAQDPVYVDMRRVADADGLSPDAAAAFYDSKNLAESERGRVVDDKTLDSDARAKALDTIAAKLNSAGIATFGEDNWNNYQASHGWWTKKAASP